MASEKGTMKGHTIGGGQKRPTKSGAGMTAKGVAKYRRDNPGSKLIKDGNVNENENDSKAYSKIKYYSSYE
jgi:hypothetical protein